MAPFRGSAPGGLSASRRAGAAAAAAGNGSSPKGQRPSPAARERNGPSDGDGGSPLGARIMKANQRNMLPQAIQATEVPEEALPGTMAITAAALAAPDRLEPRGLPDKTLGEFSELPGSNYEGSYRPARMGLSKMLESGKMRNPLEMLQSAAPWSARRPLSASRSGGQLANRAASAGRVRPMGQSKQAGFSAASGSGDFGGPHAGPLMGAGGGTQGPDKGPGMLQPQRIELPGYLNTPARRPDGEVLSPEERTQTIRKIQDLDLLTFACRRASKVREEGRAHFSLGIFRDNLGQYQKAIECYNQFLRVCKECSDGQGCALAYHCIAVDHQLLGGGLQTGGDSGSPTAAREGGGTTKLAIKPELLKKAIFFHNKHRENSDSVGKFVAHLNMGLAYAQLGERESSTVNHQYALRYALQLHSLEGQSLAIGSLGFSAGMYDKDPEKMRVLIERYVHLCDTLKQSRNQATALKKLGVIASQQGDSEQSIQYFQQAIDAARATGDREVEKDCSVRLGIAAGQAKMAEHIGNILQQSVESTGFTG